MSSRLFSLRMPPAVFDQIEARSRERGESKSRLAQRLIEEGLRLEAHPGIVFRDGPTGRRAALVHGPDVWEIIPAIRSLDVNSERALDEAAESLGLTKHQIRAAVRYYAAYPEEIDARVRRNAERAERAEAEWQRTRQ